MGIRLNHVGERLVRRGGGKAIEGGSALDEDDKMLFLEVVARAPGMEIQDYQQVMIALRMEYGLDALEAIRTGHVQFELVKPRDRLDDIAVGEA